MNTQIDVTQLSEQELEALLAKKKEEKRNEEIRKRAEYEENRDQLVTELVGRAMELSAMLAEFKQDVMERMEQFREMADLYGGIRSNSKGGFGLRHSITGHKVALDRNTAIEYDERADKAADLIRDFLQHMVKKRDQDAYEMIIAMLEKNAKGDFRPSLILALIKQRNRFGDPRWTQAIKLLGECHSTYMISMSASFYQKDGLGKDQLIPLSFAGIRLKNTEETTTNTEKNDNQSDEN